MYIIIQSKAYPIIIIYARMPARTKKGLPNGSPGMNCKLQQLLFADYAETKIIEFIIRSIIHLSFIIINIIK